MKVLVACEFSGVVREEFRKKGHDAWSCDLLDSLDNSEYHIKGDVIELLENTKGKWDLIIAHPPCTSLTVASNRYYHDKPDLYMPAAHFAFTFFDFASKVCVENPVGRLSTIYRKPDQIVQPYQFGEDASKKTCFWLKGLPTLTLDPRKRKSGRFVEYPIGSGKIVERWSNQTDSGQNILGPSKNRSNLRSITYRGIAEAMAEQWD